MSKALSVPMVLKLSGVLWVLAFAAIALSVALFFAATRLYIDGGYRLFVVAVYVGVAALVLQVAHVVRFRSVKGGVGVAVGLLGVALLYYVASLFMAASLGGI